jgi:tRNA A37 threonylcarbamoyladenosine dehydratase
MNKLLIDTNKSEENSTIYKPIFFRLTLEEDKLKIENLLRDNDRIIIYNELYSQLKELMKLLNPTRKLEETDYSYLIHQHLNGVEIEEYGVWIYYPWSYRLVHILDEHEFIEVRTNRNHYKITPKERELLSIKKVGVVGLSVGQSVAITMAMERCCGEIRLADFDSLELTNLNRIRTGIHNLGLNKTISVAREIAEIDPYLIVKCFTNGLTEGNMDDFFLKEGRLDLFIEECDGLDVKILSRYKAKELRIPVIMEASDRCMVDVERYDLNPQLPILHNLVSHLDVEKLKKLKTNEEKIPYLLDIIGIDTCSARIRASMLEIEQTITTWPQLASAVTLGGGVMTDIARRLLLNQFHDSGRYYIDVEELICDKKIETLKEESVSANYNSLSIDQMKNIISSYKFIDNFPEKIDTEKIKIIIEASSMAPSGGNMQPWKWIYENGNFYLFHDISRSDSLLDYAKHASYIALGASVENFVLKAHELNLEVLIDWLPLNNDSSLIARINLFKNKSKELETKLESHINDNLVRFIPIRFTNRKNNVDKSILSDAVMKTLKTAGESVKVQNYLLLRTTIK